MNTRREIRLTLAGLVVVALASALFYRTLAGRLVGGPDRRDIVLFLVIASGFIYGTFVYLICRMGYLRRRRDHRPTSDEELHQFAFAGSASPPAAVFLVPSYKEDPHVIFQTLWSAAF